MATEAFFKTPMMRMHLHILAALTVGIGAEQPIKTQNYYCMEGEKTVRLNKVRWILVSETSEVFANRSETKN